MTETHQYDAILQVKPVLQGIPSEEFEDLREQSFSAIMPLQMAASAFKLQICQSCLQQCNLYYFLSEIHKTHAFSTFHLDLSSPFKN